MLSKNLPNTCISSYFSNLLNKSTGPGGYGTTEIPTDRFWVNLNPNPLPSPTVFVEKTGPHHGDYSNGHCSPVRSPHKLDHFPHFFTVVRMARAFSCFRTNLSHKRVQSRSLSTCHHLQPISLPTIEPFNPNSRKITNP